MAPTLRSFTKPIVQAFKDAGIEDQLDDFDPPLFAIPYSPQPTGRGRHSRPANAQRGRQAPIRDSQSVPANCTARFVGRDWVIVPNEVWEAMYAEEERGRKARRAARLRAERRRGLGREKKKRAFLGGRKGKVVEGGRRRHGAGAVVTDKDGVTWKVGGRFKARGA